MNNRFFQNNLSLKIISVVIAVILWMYAVNELDPESTKPIYDVPVTIIHEDTLNERQLTLAEKPIDSITIRIRGLASDIRKVNTANLKAVLDLGNIDWTGTRQVELNVEGLLPREVKLDKIPEIPLTVNKITSKNIPVEVDKEALGNAAEGYYVHSPSVEPETITIYGAQSLVDSVVQGIIEVKLNNDESTIEQSLPIKLVDAAKHTVSSEYLSLRQESAMVRIPIYPVRELTVEANVTGVPANGFVVDGVEVKPKKLTVNGSSSVIEKLESMTTEAVNIQNATEDVQVTANINKVDGVYLNPGQSYKANVVVHIRETTVSKNLVLNQIELKNVPEGFRAETVGAAVSVQMKGPYTIVNPLTEQNLTPYVDFSQLDIGDEGFLPGQYELPLSITVPEGVEVVSKSAENVTVNIVPVEEETSTETPNP